VQTKKERVNLVFRIKIGVSSADGRLKPGMPADAVIATD
jgi:HlyD family secretion protein